MNSNEKRPPAAVTAYRVAWPNGHKDGWISRAPGRAYIECMESKGCGVELCYFTPPDMTLANEAIDMIAAERRRQIDAEGWSPGHDDGENSEGQLAMAAACYALHPGDEEPNSPPKFWPWGEDWWKPGDRIRELVKAGALIVAEIERLQRAAALKPEGSSDG